MADRSYASTVLVGLAGAALTAVAGSREWARAQGEAAGLSVDAATTGSESAPLVVALALLALATWGVVLVLRGRMRRLVSAVGVVASSGAFAAVVLAFDGARNDAREALMSQGGTGDVAVVSLTVWYYAAGVAALVTAVAFVVAVRRSPGWPAMGTRYDAPSARAEAPVTDEDMWRALDKGHDPTS